MIREFAICYRFAYDSTLLREWFENAATHCKADIRAMPDPSCQASPLQGD